jgi:hypothetical protein
LKQDKARTNILKISELGLVEMTRKRTRENLVQQLCEPCSNCEGRGYVLSSKSMAYKILREIRKDLPRFCGRQIAISVNPRVAEVLLARAHKACAELGQELGREIEVRGQPGLHQEQFEVTALDSGPPVSIPLQWLGFPPEASDEKAAGADLPIQIDEASSAAVANPSGAADTAGEPPETTPTPPESEAPLEAAEAKKGESSAAEEEKAQPVAEQADAEEQTVEPATEQADAEGQTVEPATEPEGTEEQAAEPGAAKTSRAASARKRAPRKPRRTATPSEQPAPTEATPEAAAAPEDDSTAGPAFSAGAGESEKSVSAPASTAEMLDLEPETPILPPPAKVEEP